jgi:D-glycero-alpha-D-manno-heptose-7-phosphate kinase
MIISKTPFRISLFGGSTDYESFYSEHGSLLIGFTIDKYCYISVRENPKIFDYKSKISYSEIERVDDNLKIKHNGVRGVLEHLNLLNERLEISTFSDLPAQTGIGSSSAFVAGLIKALRPTTNKLCLAKLAILVERYLLKEAGGIQDQIWAAYGGLNSIEINRDGIFSVKPLPVSDEFIQEFIDRSFLLYTGNSRQSFKIASSHNTGSEDLNKLNIQRLAHNALMAFSNEDINEIAYLLNESWQAKKSISNLVSTSEVDEMMDYLSNYGMLGGKLIGSGGSGFIFGIAKDMREKERIKYLFSQKCIDFSISKTGSSIINE